MSLCQHDQDLGCDRGTNNALNAYLQSYIHCLLVYVYFVEILVKLSPFLTGQIAEKQIRDATTTVLATYHKMSGLLRRYSDHGEKISRVHQTLCDCIRRTDQILASLREARAVTPQEYEYISFKQSVPHEEVTRRLLDVISGKSAATYRCFLNALDATGQHHLHRHLEDRGLIFLYCICRFSYFIIYKLFMNQFVCDYCVEPIR